MTIATLLQFLIGRESAIREIAGNRKSLLIGFIFCFSAALARHYDGEYLLRKPWLLLAPAGASILTSGILFTAMCLVGAIASRGMLRGFGSAYLSFLGLYWMTAPLAWLYGIPYERFLNEFDAAQANVWTLELVSIWRVVLMSRVFSVLVPLPFSSAFFNLGTFAFALVYCAMNYARLPLVNFMGGVRISPGAEPVASLHLSVMIYGFFALVFGGLFVLTSCFIKNPAWSLTGFLPVQPGRMGRQLPALALVVILIFCAALPMAQSEQALRYRVECEYQAGQLGQALSTLVARQRNEFPPQWTPPPWPDYADGEHDPKFFGMLALLEQRRDVPEWITDIYRAKAVLYVQNNHALPDGVKFLLQRFAEPHTLPTFTQSLRELALTPVHIDFSSPKHASVFVQTTLGSNDCDLNQGVYGYKLGGDAGWSLTVFAKETDRLCYRTVEGNTMRRGEWQEVKRLPNGKDEKYQITLP